MALPLGISCSLNFLLSVTSWGDFFFNWIFLTPSSVWLTSHHYHWPIIGITTYVFMTFGANLNVIIAISRLCQFFAISLHGSFYLQSWLAIIDLLTLVHLSLMILSPSNIVPYILVSSLSCYILYVGKFIGSNLMQPMPNFLKNIAHDDISSGSTTALMMVFTLFRVL